MVGDPPLQGVAESALLELRKAVELARTNEIESVTERRKNALEELSFLVNAKSYTQSAALASLADTSPDAFDRFIQSPPLIQGELDESTLTGDDDGLSPLLEDSLLENSRSAINSNIPSKRLRVAAPVERMVTRGVSGAIRHKHISELTGGFLDGPRQNSPGVLSPELRPDSDIDPFRSSQPLQSLENQRPRPPQRKHSRQPSAPQRTTTPTKRPSISVQTRAKSSAIERMRANMLAWQIRAEHQPLYKQVQSAKKVVSSQEWKICRNEVRLLRAIQRVEQLKEASMWSFRQPKRHKAPPRTKTHWDYVLDEMKWLRIDFKEERKWKQAMAFHFANWIREWHHSEDKQSLQVKTRPPRFLPMVEPNEMTDWSATATSETKEETTPSAVKMQIDSDTSVLTDKEQDSI
ncbi:HSA-domain-containing protein [Syncephalis fuscata]|nr:HSA-domain-containing protein [Syncephalis fuscata]